MTFLHMYSIYLYHIFLSSHALTGHLSQYHNLANVNIDSLNKVPISAGISAQC